MKQLNTIKILIAFLFLVAANTSSFGQNTTVKDSVYTYSLNKPSWKQVIYRSGNNLDWAQPTIALDGWKNLSLKDFDENADANGNIEGWIRLKFKLDDSWKNKPLRIRYNFMAAAEVYIDGKLFGTYGNLGSDTEEFRFFSENNPSERINLTLNETHTIAIHIKDKLIYPTQISGSTIGLRTGWSKNKFLTFTTDDAINEALLFKSSRTIYFTLWPAVNFIIGFLFFFLYLLNKKEKNLLLYTGVCLGLGINVLSNTLFNFAGYIDLQPMTLLLLSLSNGITLSLILTLLFFSIIKIFDIKLQGLNRWLYIGFLILITVFIVSYFVGLYTTKYEEISNIIFLISMLSFALILIYWTIISFRNSTLPQKVIAYGVILLFLLFIIFIIAIDVFNMHLGSNTSYNLITAIYFCFPISLLAYVVLRFQEINRNIVLNSAQIVQLSEEKRVMAEGQQKLLEHQVTKRTEDLQKSLSDLKATQSQLIQSEKMASLGELTAGIAHEIQNPLNFVNNFSEVSNELVDEMKDEFKKGDLEEGFAIADDIKQNLEKINHHGKRADAIVKGMLQHSRTSSAEKEPTDLNRLADEYLRLAYHGLRAKDKSFNANLETDFDENIGKINIIPQDIGRVILNLITNAFYACQEKQKSSPDSYKPTVTITSKLVPLLGGAGGGSQSVKITVTDNGNGIPESVKDKIFQPFFTTKPTGSGTGLGLSLSYDIVKSHGGEMRVESEEGVGTTFSITLPIKMNHIS